MKLTYLPSWAKKLIGQEIVNFWLFWNSLKGDTYTDIIYTSEIRIGKTTWCTNFTFLMSILIRAFRLPKYFCPQVAVNEFWYLMLVSCMLIFSGLDVPQLTGSCPQQLLTNQLVNIGIGVFSKLSSLGSDFVWKIFFQPLIFEWREKLTQKWLEC